MTAYYNEIDAYAAQWLRNLIAAKHIAAGEVDERSICDVDAKDLTGFTQCHFFAGIGVWSRALRLAGWPDDRPVWTGSCPCQPFSAAGKRGGFDDERHLWPELFRLVRERRPAVVFGEQVASKDGLQWLDTVQADLEGAGYASAAADLCAAGVGAPHIRQRLYWVGHAEGNRSEMRVNIHGELRGQRLTEGCDSGRMADAQHDDGRANEQRWGPQGRIADGRSGAVVRLADTVGVQREREPHIRPAGLCKQNVRQAERGDGFGDMGASTRSASASRPTNGFWADADWLYCRDRKWRPVEPGTFPLAHGATARVGRLRAYGNAIVPQVAQAFVEAFMECRP